MDADATTAVSVYLSVACLYHWSNFDGLQQTAHLDLNSVLERNAATRTAPRVTTCSLCTCHLIEAVYV